VLRAKRMWHLLEAERLSVASIVFYFYATNRIITQRAGHTASSGVRVLLGLRQSMPSSNIDNRARVSDTVPSVACGQMKRNGG
jgi:hypothetical protein